MIDKSTVVFVSGANRGIGFELTRQLSQQGSQVVAGYRDKDRSEKLLELSHSSTNIFPFNVDVTEESLLGALNEFIDQKFGYLDIIFNNAAINFKRNAALNDLEWSDISQHLEVNVGGAFLTARYLYPLLKKGTRRIIVNISSRLGSMELCIPGSIPYSISKASLNMLTRHQAMEYKKDGVTVISISPGWVRTDMGGHTAPLSVEESVSSMLKVVDDLSLTMTGQFLDVDGTPLPF